MTESKKSRNEYSPENSNELFARFSDSFHFDWRLFRADVRVGIAYADALFQAGIMTRLEAEKIRHGLETLLKRADFDRNYFSDADAPDIYSFIETKLIQLIGETGAKLQTGRSRAEQSATVLRLWLREEIEAVSGAVKNLQKAFFDAAKRHETAVLPGYAGRRKVTPMLWAHWCLAYFEMLARDRERLDEVWRRTNVLPLGSGVLAGNSFEIDRETLARELNFEGVTANSLDAVTNRDFAVEFVGAGAILMLHLSRLAEDLLLYASAEFGFVEFSGAASDREVSPSEIFAALELTRGKAGRIFGHQTALFAALENLPSGDNWREIEAAIFDAADTVKISLRIIAVVLQNLRVNEEKTRQAATEGYLNAAELADYLVKKGVSVRTARETTDKIVTSAIAKNKKLDKLNLGEFREFSAEIEADVFAALSLEATLANKSGIGGTAPEQIAARLEEIGQELERDV